MVYLEQGWACLEGELNKQIVPMLEIEFVMN